MLLPLTLASVLHLAQAGGAVADTPPPEPQALEPQLLDHIKKVDAIADRLAVPELPEGKDWFNSPPLRFDRELRGKVVVLDFWTYCCINCIHVLPDLAELERKYAGQPVAVVGVHSAKFENEKLSENIRQAVLRYEIEHPVVNDDEMLLWRQIGVRSWPSLAVVGPKGNLMLMLSGEGHKETLDAFIGATLSYYPAEAFRHDPLPVTLERERAVRSSPLRFPGKLAIDAKGDATASRLYISDSNHNRIVVTDLEGRFVEAIGSGRIGLVDGSYNEARFNRLQGLAVADGVVWVADAENHALRRVDLAAKTVTTVAGNGTQGRDYEGGGRGREQLLSTPWDVVVRDGVVFIAMAGTHQIWTHTIATGVTSAYSGSGRELNLNDALDPRAAAWAQPSGLTIGDDDLFVADSESSTVRAIDLDSGASRALVGGDDNPRNLFAFGDVDGVGMEARLQHVLGVLWLPATQRVLVADTYNHRLKLLDPAERRVTAWAGSGTPGHADGAGLEARFSEPSGFALAPGGKRVFVADTNNHAVRIVDLETAAVSTLALDGVPAALEPFAPRSERLADLPDTPTVRAETLALKPGEAGTLSLRVSLPLGYDYTEGAGSRWQVLAEEGAPVTAEEARASGALEGDDAITIPVRAVGKAASGTVRVEALAYYCKADKVCRVGAVVFEVPVEVGPGGRASVELAHAFAAGDRVGSVAPPTDASTEAKVLLALRRSYEAHALTHDGDERRGRALFLDEKRTRCATCHKVGEDGGAVGPELSSVGGKFDRPHLIESLLEPSKQIGYGYETSVVATKDGRLLTGVVKREAEDELVLVDAEAAEHTLAAKDIAQRTDGEASLMPEGLADELSAEEFTDLVAYLESLRDGGKLTPGEGKVGRIALPDGFAIETVVTGLTGCTALETTADGRVFVCEQTGAVRVVKDGALLDEPFVTLPVDSHWERGVIGVTVHPGFPSTPYVSICWVAKEPYPHHRVSRFTARGDVAEPGSEKVLLAGDDQRTLGGTVPAGHQGGGIHFGPDGMLYVAIGENTAEKPSQSLRSFQGKLLRIDAEGGIPDDNPFLEKTEGKYGAIWALGLRNPFTFAFRASNGDLLINDVGGKDEEINRGERGANYGWPTVDHGPTKDARFRGPIHHYKQASISGGDFSADDHPWPEALRGRYFFADFVHGWIKTLDPERPERVETFVSGLRRPVDLRFAPSGDLYVLVRNAWVVDDKFQPGTGSLLRIRYRGEH